MSSRALGDEESYGRDYDEGRYNGSGDQGGGGNASSLPGEPPLSSRPRPQGSRRYDEESPLVGDPRNTKSSATTRATLVTVSIVAVALGIAVIGMAVYILRLRTIEEGSLAPIATDEEMRIAAQAVESAMDKSANPCEDFYQYACGGWLKASTIPPDRSSWGRGFTVIEEQNIMKLRGILERNIDHISDYYTSCMNGTKLAEANGTKPLNQYLSLVSGAQNFQDLVEVAGSLVPVGVGAFLSMGVSADSKDPTKNILDFGQGGLTLPERTYYLDDKKAPLRVKYEAHISKMFGLFGYVQKESGDAEKRGKGVLEFEKKLAELHVPPAELRDPVKTYNKYNWDTLRNQSSFPWDRYFKGAAVDTASLDANLDVPAYFVSLTTLLNATEVPVLKDYVAWHLFHTSASLFTQEIMDESFDFFGKTLSGQEKQAEPWKRCVRATDAGLGDLLGREYVQRYFPGKSKEMAENLVQRIEKSFEDNLGNVDWLDGETRQRALGKLRKVGNKIGYPEKWKDYSSLSLSPTDHFGNVMAVRKFLYADQMAQLKKPVDKNRWDMTPPTVNAYYDPNANQMVFPAGIIQPMFFNLTFPAPLNFGGMGAVMGHELTHGFDDQGAQYDGDGKLTDWWSTNVTQRFKERTKCVVDLYSGYEILGGAKVNGSLTTGENIADMGGVKAAYRAYVAFAKELGTDVGRLVPSLSNEQLFFVAYGQSWCTLRKPEYAERLILTDPHSPPKFRVNGPLSNFDTFSKVFQCKEGTPMNPKKKCSVW